MPYGVRFEDLAQPEQAYVTLLLGADALWGGDAMHESGAAHFIADAWFSGMEPPAVYRDPIAAQLRATGGVAVLAPSQREVVRDYVLEHGLLEQYPALLEGLAQLPEERALFLRSNGHALKLILETAISQLLPGSNVPSYDEKYRAVAGRDAALVDPAPYRDALRAALEPAGYPASEAGLRAAAKSWKGACGAIPEGSVVGKTAETVDALLARARKSLLPLVDFKIPGYAPDLADVLFDGFAFKTVRGMFFTGSNIYQGGGRERPRLRALFEYNLDHHLTAPEMVHLAAHEVIGHYLHAAVTDLLWRAEKLPVEASMATMCTPSGPFQEGWAENMLDMLYGSREAAVAAHGPNIAAVLALARLESVGKHNASILFQREGRSLDDVRAYLAEECVLPDEKVNKLSGAWATHPVFGPMYGPAYHWGTETVGQALKRAGVAEVARIGFQIPGQVANLRTFEAQLP